MDVFDFETQTLVGGEWREVQTFATEAEALASVCERRAAQRRCHGGFAQGYRIAEKRRGDGWTLLPMILFPADVRLEG